MRQLILFAVTVLLVYALSKPKFHEFIAEMAGHRMSKEAMTMIIAVLFGIVIVMVDNSFPCIVKENFTFTEQRYSTNPVNQYVGMDDYYGNQFFHVPVDVDRVNQPKLDHFSKYYIGRNEGLIHKYAAASDKPEACQFISRGGVLATPASTVFEGKPLSYYQRLSQNSGMPLWNTRWKW